MVIINVDGIECVMGTRLPVDDVLALWNDGKSLEDIKKYAESKGYILDTSLLKSVIQEGTLN